MVLDGKAGKSSRQVSGQIGAHNSELLETPQEASGEEKNDRCCIDSVR